LPYLVTVSMTHMTLVTMDFKSIPQPFFIKKASWASSPSWLYIERRIICS